MNKKNVSLLSTIANIILAGLKILIGLLANSSAILASGLDSLSDILSSFLVFIGIKVSEKESSSKYPYGLYRAESITSLGVFLFVLFASLGIIYDSTTRLINKDFDVHVSLLALGVMVFSAIISSVLSYLKIKEGKAQNSVSLVLDGKHSLIDVITSVGVLVGLLLSRVLPIFDSIVGLLIGLFILFGTVKMAKDVIDGLLDTADQESEKQVSKICKDEEIEVSTLKSRRVAARTFIELEIVLPTDIKVKKADDIVANLQKLIMSKNEQIERVVIQIKGGERRHQLSRGDFGKGKQRIDKTIMPELAIEKQGFRTIYPYKDGKVTEVFGSVFYLVVDRQGEKVMSRRVVKNPFYRVGRSHGVQFARDIGADRVIASDIGENARKMLGQANIDVSSEK